MRSYLSKTPNLVKLFFFNLFWHFSKKEKVIYLTFDDGPTPEITDWVLEVLLKYNAQVTFFCVGKNIENNPLLFDKIVSQNHSIGNHTFNHLNGFKSNYKVYLNDIDLTENILEKKGITTKLFRPPYGRLTYLQSRKLRKKSYKIIMWDVLSGDFDKGIDEETCLQNVIKNIDNGSIVVFHDSIKASEKLKFALPQILNYYTFKGYTFKGIF